MTPETHATLSRALLAMLDDRDPERAALARAEHAQGLALAQVVNAGLVRKVSPAGRDLLAATYAALFALLERPQR